MGKHFNIMAAPISWMNKILGNYLLAYFTGCLGFWLSNKTYSNSCPVICAHIDLGVIYPVPVQSVGLIHEGFVATFMCVRVMCQR